MHLLWSQLQLVLSCHTSSVLLSASSVASYEFVVDDWVVTEQKCLCTVAHKAEEAIAQKAKEIATLAMHAAYLWRQLDFLDCYEETILWSELECLELLGYLGVRVLEPFASSPSSPLSFSDVMGVLN